LPARSKQRLFEDAESALALDEGGLTVCELTRAFGEGAFPALQLVLALA
jgi:hypothetical protein